MKLLFVCKSLPYSFKGGIQTHVWELTRELVARGNEVTILTAGSWRIGLETREHEGRSIIHLPYFPGRRFPLLRKTLEDISFNLAAFAWLKRHAKDYDRVHIQGRSGCFHAALAPRNSTEIITTYHRLIDVEYEYDGQRTGKLDGWFHRKIMGFAERAAARNADHIIAVSEEMKRELVEYVNGSLAPISIIPNGVNKKFGDPVVDKSRWQLVFVGRLEKIKGVYTLLNALKIVDKRVELIFVGDGPERKGLEQLTKKLGLRLRVKFLGDQDAEAVRYWIQRSYALVLPSFHESQGIVLLEAGVCSRPVIAASAPGIDEVVDHGYNGLMFPVGDVTSLSVVINHLFKTPALATKLGKNGRHRVFERYDWEGIALRTLEVYNKVGVSGIGEYEYQYVPKDVLPQRTLPTTPSPSVLKTG